MKLTITAILLFAVLMVNAQHLVQFGQPDSVYSAILKENRPLWIYTPPQDTPYFSKQVFPVIYMLDGDGYFATLQSMIFQLSTVNDNTALPQMIIVGIPNTRNHRLRDLTPSADSAVPGSGGGEAFTSFLEKELIPYIEKKYATAPFRILAGHSLGGLMAVNTLINHPSLFNAVIAIDPSISWNHSYLLKQAGQRLKETNLQQKACYMAIAHTMQPGLDSVTVRTDKTLGAVHTSAIFSLADELRAHPGNGLRWGYKYYEDDDHQSVPVIALYDGLRFIFHHSRFPTFLYNDNSPADSVAQLVIAHYKMLSRELGYTVRPRESQFNFLGYRQLIDKNFEKARMLFQLNTYFYQERANPYDSMGDYYMAVKDPVRAASNWKKALSIQYNRETRDKLDKLQQPSSH